MLSARPRLLRLALFAVGFACGLPALAQVVSGPDGPRLGQAANGVPVVDINAPNARGVSHNRYQQFNVDAQGLILNNQTAGGRSQLGGYVAGNERLQGRAAGLIVNEVTGTAPSALRGYMEVAGQRAGVVVANPNGISCVGCGFINTPQATLSTGVPQWAADGGLQGFAVTRGGISIDGHGLDASSSDRLTLIARAIQINAGIWSGQITASSGAAQFDVHGVAQQPLRGEGERPQLGIDVAALGGMYAGHIRLLGNEHGVGVASAGELIAREGQLRIDSAGNLRLVGTTQADRDALVLRATGNVQAEGRQAAGGSISVHAGGTAALGGDTQTLGALEVAGRTVALRGRSRSNGALTLHAGQALAVTGAHWAGQGMALRAAGDAQVDAQLQTPAALLLRTGGALRLAGQLQSALLEVQANALHSTAQVDAHEATVRAGSARFAEDAVLAGDALQLQIAGVLDNSGTLLARQALALQAAQLRNDGDVFGALGVQAQLDALDNRGRIGSEGALALHARSLRNSGQIAGANVRLQADALDNRDGVIGSTTGALDLAATQLDNRAGTLRSAGALSLSVDAELDNREGRIDSDEAAQIRAGALDNSSGRIVAGSADVQVDQHLDNTGGLIGTREGDLLLQAGALGNQAGTVQAASRAQLQVAAALDNQRGRISGAQLQLRTGGAVDNRSGQLLATDGALGLSVGGSVDNRGGTVGTQAGDIHLHSAGNLDNRDGGTVLSAGALTLSANGVLRNAGGRIDSHAAATLTATALDNQQGRLVADTGALQLRVTDAVDNRRGTLGSIGAAVDVRAARLSNDEGQLIAGGNLQVQADALGNRQGLLQAGGNARLHAQHIDNRGGQLLAGRALQLQAAHLDNRHGLLSAGDAELQVDVLDNQQDGRSDTGVFANGALTARLAQLHGDGRLFGNGALQLHLLGDYQHAIARLQSNGLLALDVAGTLTNLGTLSSPGQLQIRAAHLDNRGQLSAANAGGNAQLLLQLAGRLDNSGRIGADLLQADAHLLHNTGIVLGNQVQLRAAQIINGRDLGQADNSAAPYNEGTLAAVHTLQLNAGSVHNLDGLIYSGDALRIGGQDGGSAARVENVSGQIQAGGGLQISAAHIDNRRRIFETRTHTLSAEEQAANQRVQHSTLDWWNDAALADACEAFRRSHNGGWRCKPGAMGQAIDTWTVTALTRLARASAEAQLLAGGAMTLHGNLRNHSSTVAAGGDLAISGQVQNIAFAPQVSVAHSRVAKIRLQVREKCGVGTKNCWRDRQPGDMSTVHDTALPLDGDLSFIRIDTGAALAARLTANGAVDIRGPGLSNGIVETGQGVIAVGGALEGSAGAGWSVPGLEGAPPVLVGSPEHPLPDLLPPDNGLFTQNRDPNARYLVETDPRFTEYHAPVVDAGTPGDSAPPPPPSGSDYLLDRLGHDPSTIRKRLGDGYYEQQLVLQQLTQLTGRRYLGQQVGSGLEQYRALMDGAALEAARFELAVGVGLTAGQIAALTTDIVWLVEQDVLGQRVLVPVVYLSQATASRLQLDGNAAIAGNSVEISSSGAVHNRGQISGVQGVAIDAASLRNDGSLHSEGLLWASSATDLHNTGRISGGDVVLEAGRDLLSAHARGSSAPRIEADGTLELSAGRDITLRNTQLQATGSATLEAGHDLRLEASQLQAGSHAVVAAGNDVVLAAQQHHTQHGEGNRLDDRVVHEVSRIDAAGELLVSAGRDLRSEGTQLQASGSLALDAGRDVQLDAVADEQRTSERWREGRTSVTEQVTTQTLRGTTLQSGDEVVINAGRDATLTAAQVRSQHGGIAIGAGRDVNLLAGEEAHSWEQQRQAKKSGLLSSTRTSATDRVDERFAVGTVLSGEQIQIAAQRDITARGVQAAATGDVRLSAGRHLDIGAAQNTTTETHQSQRSKSGVMSGMGGGLGVTFGKRGQGSQSTLQEQTAQGSVIGSTAGGVLLTAGERLRVSGSDVLSQTGTTLVGESVTVEAAEQRTGYQQRDHRRQSGLNVAIGGATVEQVQAARAVYATARHAGEVEDDRLQALYAVRAAQGAVAVAEAAGQRSGGDGGGNGNGLNVRITAGSQSSRSELDAGQVTHRGSTVRSAGDVVIAATGGDLEIVGSEVRGRNVGLSAANNLSIRSSHDHYWQHSRSQSQGGEAGVAISGSSNGGAAVGFYVGANAARGNSDGQGTLHNESLIQASDALVFSSGGDTLLQGAQLRGEQVVGRVGGNLTLRSEQDTDRYDSRQLALKGEATIGYGFDGSASGSASLIDSQYRSVREQTGIEAGSGGFQLHVDGHTALIGAAIASSADAARNQLTTGSLSAEELRNEARYLAASVSGGTSGGGSPGDMRFDAGAALGVPTGDSRHSTTRSGLADATVVIADGDRSALQGLQRGVTALDDGTGFAPIFDPQKVEERQALTNLLGQMGFEAAGDLAASRRAQAQAALASAQANGNAQGIAEATAQLEAWSEGGRNKVLLHGLTGAAVAALSGGDVVRGAAGSAGAERARDAIYEYLEGHGVAPGTALFDSLMELGSAAVGGALAGTDGAAGGLLGDRFNRQLHPDEVRYLAELAPSFADELFGCGSRCTAAQIDQARGRLIVEAYADVDAVGRSQAGSDAVASSFLGRHPKTFDWGQAFFVGDAAEFGNSSLYKDLYGKDPVAFGHLQQALLGNGKSVQYIQNSYHQALLDLASKARGSDGKTIIGTFTGDIGAAFGIVNKLAEGDTAGAGIEAALAAAPLGIGKVVAPAGRAMARATEGTYWLNGKVINAAWVNAGGELTWINPLTNMREVLPAAAKVHVDHVLPKNEIVKMDGFDRLPRSVQKQLLDDPQNLQPMLASANCSKGCRVEAVEDGWVYWNGKPVDAQYKKYLNDSQDAFREHVRRIIEMY